MAGIEKGPLFGGKGSRAVDNKNLHVAAVAVVNFETFFFFFFFWIFHADFSKVQKCGSGQGPFYSCRAIAARACQKFSPRYLKT